MKQMNVTVSKKGYDALQEIVNFNLLSGNTCERRSIQDTLPQLYLDLIAEESLELEQAIADNNLKETLDALGDMMVVCSGMIHSLGFHPNDVLKVVNDSNLSKFCKDGQEARRSVQQYEGDSRYMNVHYRTVETGGETRYVIFGEKSAGGGWKILKSWKYEDASEGLSNLIEQQAD